MFNLEPNYVQVGDIWVGTTYRVASQSIKSQASKNHVFANEALELPGDKIIFVRHPLDRLESAYKLFMPTDRYSSSYEEFVDNVLSGDENWHWLPQHDWHTVDGSLVPDICYKFENINLILYGLPTLNTSNSIKIATFYRYDELLSYYEKDLELYRSSI